MIAATDNPPMVAYTPYGGVAHVWSCKARRVLCDGPAGTGKSRGILEKVSLAARKYPGMRALLVRKTRASMTESTLVTLESSVLVDANGEREAWVGTGLRRNRQSYVLPNGSEIIVGGMDNSDRILSTEYDMIAVFEATELTEDDIEKLTTRLRNGRMPYQQLICDCNPSSPTHHLKRAADAGRMARFPSRHEDNPRLWDADAKDWTEQGRAYLATLKDLTGHRRARFLEGVWAAAEGLVYPEFDAAVHVIPEMPAGWMGWRKLRCVDFGHTNPFVCQWWAIDPDGRAYLYREIYRTKRIVADHAKRIAALSEGESYEVTIADHDAEDRATLSASGIDTIAAHKAVVPGLQAVTARLVPAADGKPRLFVLRGCTVDIDPALDAAKKPTTTEGEFDGYVYPSGKAGRALKEEPVKENDHGMDAMRYAVAYLDIRAGNGAWVAGVGGGGSAPASLPAGGDGSAGAWVGGGRVDRAFWSKV